MVFASFITKDIKMQSVVNLSLEIETFSGPTFYLHIQNSPSGTISNVKNTLSEYTTYLQVQSFHISCYYKCSCYTRGQFQHALRKYFKLSR